MAETRSYWLDSTPARATFEPVSGRLRATVAIVGGGISGVTALLLLKRAGVQAVLVEADRVGSGVTGHTTGKLTAGQGLTYASLESSHGEDAAALYAESQLAALGLVRDLVSELAIDCDLESVSDYVFAESGEEMELLEEELEASRRAGLPRVLERGRGQPVPAAIGALRLGDQSQFHARKYVLSLAQVAHGDGCRVHEGSRVLELEKDETYVLRTDAGEVEADYVVLATGAPITMEGLFFARAHAWQHYAVAAPVNKDALQGSWIGAGTPVRSLRTAPLDASRRLLIVVGENHKVGQSDDTTRPYAALAGFLARNFSGAEITHRWSAHDQFSVDRLPYIGRTGAPDSRLFVATGFGGWGLTNGTIAAFVIRDAILGRSNDWSELFDPNRSTLVRAPGALVRENVNVAKQLVGGKLRGRDTDVESLEAGDGAVVDLDGQRVAAYRDESGGLRTVSATCTHMGCVVEWNEAEKTWDCPCHGSRFSTDGAVLHGPATHPLEAVAFAEDRTRAPLS